MRALVFLNGELHTDLWQANPEWVGPWDLVICADGGGYHALALGYKVDILLGDFDSLSSQDRKALHADMVYTFSTAKDATDAELAVLVASERGVTEVVLAGALGGRLDHTLANVGLLSLMHQMGITSCATDGQQIVHLVTADSSPLVITAARGQVISLLPLTTIVEGVTITGVRWPLDNARLLIGSTRTVSNEITNSPASVQVGAGELLVITHYNGTA